MADESAKGSSNIAAIASKISSTFGRRISSVCSVPSSAATALAAADSSYFSSANPIENVRTRPDAWRHIKATTVEESKPPDRNAPSGTSDSRCDATAASSFARRVSTISRSSIDRLFRKWGRPVPADLNALLHVPQKQMPRRQLSAPPRKCWRGAAHSRRPDTA